MQISKLLLTEELFDNLTILIKSFDSYPGEKGTHMAASSLLSVKAGTWQVGNHKIFPHVPLGIASRSQISPQLPTWQLILRATVM